jgi:DNA sulfur modification protein DndD
VEELGEYSGDFFATLRCRLEELLTRYVGVQEKTATLEGEVGAIPDEAKIQGVLESIQTANERLISAKATLEVLFDERQAVERERLVLERKRDQFLDQLSEEQASDIISRRVITHSARCRETLAKFRQAMRGRHVERLEQAVTKCFQRLLRKKTLVHRIQIDPESFQLRIRGGNDSLIPAERLSAGERQILAVAVLWGLAIASGRQLPAVIDTPMGRLDSEHRRYLVEQYFPVASHQVILLSTDEEIDGAYYERLQSAICREYVLTYDEQTHSSMIRPGYFSQSRIAA